MPGAGTDGSTEGETEGEGTGARRGPRRPRGGTPRITIINLKGSQEQVDWLEGRTPQDSPVEVRHRAAGTGPLGRAERSCLAFPFLEDDRVISDDRGGPADDRPDPVPGAQGAGQAGAAGGGGGSTCTVILAGGLGVLSHERGRRVQDVAAVAPVPRPGRARGRGRSVVCRLGNQANAIALARAATPHPPGSSGLPRSIAWPRPASAGQAGPAEGPYLIGSSTSRAAGRSRTATRRGPGPTAGGGY